MKRLLLLLTALLLPVFIYGQDGESPITYKSLAIQASTLQANGEAKSAVTTSVASYNGFGSFIDNPAAMALANKSSYSIGWFNQRNNKTDSYLGNSSSANYLKTNLGNLGLVYKVPTDRGSFVVGGGYTLISKNNDETFLDGFNQNNSITDIFKQPGNEYGGVDGPAFNAFAVDYKNNTSDELESIFRLNSRPSGFQGINQFADITNEKTVGDISIFAATEFQKNLYAGISLGFINGIIRYDRSFQEIDESNSYNDGVIPADGTNPATDIYSISLKDELDTEFYGFSARGGVVFKPIKFISVGASVALPSKLFITENYFGSIATEFDDFTTSESESISFDFNYAITKPAEFKLGASLSDGNNLNVSASIEYINYGETKVDFTTDTKNLSPADLSILKQDEQFTNAAIKEMYAAVINLKASASYEFSNNMMLLAGYAYYPSKVETLNFNESVYSGGISVPIATNISIDLSAQYSNINDRSLQYEFVNNGGQTIQNFSDKEFKRVQIIGGLTFSF